MADIPNPLKLAYVANMSPATYAQQTLPRLHSGTTMERHGLAQARFELHPVDLNTWDDGAWGHPIFLVRHPDQLHEPWPYRFQNGQDVWVCASDGEWYSGKVVSRPKSGPTRLHEGLYWCVEFLMGRVNIRKWFAPLNGEIKPDSQHTHQLLTEAGWLECDRDDY